MSEIISIQSNHPFVGKWKSSDDMSEVVITVKASNSAFSVSAVDKSDNEIAEVSQVGFENGILLFTLYWPSTGRQTSYRFLLQSKNTVSVTYTYTATEIWQKHET